jgi:hypothetical protein
MIRGNYESNLQLNYRFGRSISDAARESILTLFFRGQEAVYERSCGDLRKSEARRKVESQMELIIHMFCLIFRRV